MARQESSTKSSGCPALLAAALLLWLFDRPASAQTAHANQPRASASDAHARLVKAYGGAPLHFEPNQGQTDAPVHFLSNGLGYSIFLTSSEAVLALHPPKPNGRSTVLRMRLVGANPQSGPRGLDEFPGRANYFLGNDPQKWRANVPTFAKVEYRDVYTGIDVIYHGNGKQLEYDFVVAPGADPAAIKLAISGARKRRIDGNGDLVLKLRGGEIRLRKPTIYQRTERGEIPVEGRYVLLGRNEVGFRLAPYDAAKPLIIDPIVTYSTYLGGDVNVSHGQATTEGLGIALDPAGNIYVVGNTDAVADGVFPLFNAHFPNPPSSMTLCSDLPNAFVAKLDSAGNRIYVTYLGGTSCNKAEAIAADANGKAYVTGWTDSSDFPIAPNAASVFQATIPRSGALNSFVTQFDANGGLLYSSYITDGGNSSVALDGSGNVFLAGEADDSLFSAHTTPNPGAYKPVCDTEDSFILEFTLVGGVLPAMPAYASCLASNSSRARVALDASGHVYLTGAVRAPTSFLVKNGFQASVAGKQDAFLMKLSLNGMGTNDLLYSTFFGGTLDEIPTGIAADAAGNAYIVGNTGSSDLPVTLTAITPACLPSTVGPCTAFVAKVNTNAAGASSLAFSTYLGGSSADDDAEGVALDGSGNAYVTGFTASANFPTANPLYLCPGCFAGSESMFVTEFSPTGTILFSTFLGGTTVDNDQAFSIAFDSAGALYLTGVAGSTNLPPGSPLPACENPIQSTIQGFFDAFVVKISPGTGTSTFSPLSSTHNPSVFGQLVFFTASVSAVGCIGGLPMGTVSFLDGATPLGTTPLINGMLAFPTSGLSVGSHSISASYPGNANFTGSNSAVLIQTVNLAATQTVLTAAPNPANLGANVTFTATVSAIPPGAGTPSGTVTFLDGMTILGTAPLISGVATFPDSALSAGNHPITASYGGDGNFTASTSAQLIEQVVVFPPAISKAFGATAIVQGFSTSLSFSITNPNPVVSLLGVGFTDILPAGLVIASPNGLSGSCGGGAISAVSGTSTVTLAGATLPGGAACNFSVNVTGTAAGTLINITQNVTSSNAGMGNPASAVITVLPAIVFINVAESVHVTDTPQVPSVFINVAESVHVMDTAAVYNTPSGSNVMALPVDTTTGTTPVTLTFSNVSQPGTTSLTTSSGGPPPPSGFQLGSPPVYYNLTTTASFTGMIQICIHYAGIMFQTPPGPRLFHFESGMWVDRTTSLDTVNMIVCGSVSSLSPFALFQPTAVPTMTSISAPGVTYGTPASVMVSVASATSGIVTGTVALSVDGGAASAMALSMGSATFNLGILNAGSHALSASYIPQGSFLPSSAAGMLSVGLAPLTIAANNTSRPYGANNPPLTGMLTGVRNGDSITANFTTTAVPASPVGTYPITPVVFDPSNRLGNYALMLVNGTLSVTRETTSLSVTASPSTVLVGHSATITMTLTAPDLVIPIDPAVLAPITLKSSNASDILTNNGTCAPAPGPTTGTASCSVTLTAIEPNGRTLTASFPGSSALAASTGTAELMVTAPLESKVSCIKSDFRNVPVPGGSYVWFNSVVKIAPPSAAPATETINLTYSQSSIEYQYRNPDGSMSTVHQVVPDAKIVFNPNITAPSITFDAANNAWLTTVPLDTDDNSFLTGLPWLVPAGGIPGDIEPVTWCGTFASDTPGLEIGWRWAAAAYSSFSADNTALGVKPMDTDHNDSGTNKDRAGTPENYKQFVIPGARGNGGKNYTGSYSGSAEIE